jgi:hypothetical protein
MEKSKLTVRVPRDFLEGANRYESEHETTLTRLVSEFLRRLSIQDDPLADAPVVRGLSGTLSPDASIEEYCKYLEEMHGGCPEWCAVSGHSERAGLWRGAAAGPTAGGIAGIGMRG